MKKIILSFLTLASIVANAQNVNIPDANFKAFLVGESSINTNNDAEIQVSEANAYSGAIDCQNLYINDLTGIETFTSLTALNCSNNTMNLVDVSLCQSLETLKAAFGVITTVIPPLSGSLVTLGSYNNSLATLDLSYSPQLEFADLNNTSLTSIDITNCPNLKSFYLGNVQISTLDLSSSLLIDTLSVTGSLISTLDLSLHTGILFLSSSNCINLTELNIANGNNTNISIFHVLSNPNLTCIQVDDTTYSATNWTLVDPTMNFSTNCSGPCTVNIPDANFKAYLVGNAALNTNGNSEIECSEASAFTGQISCLNLSIADVTGIEAFTALTYLYLEVNQITNLDLSNNTALTYLSCNSNNIASLDLSNNTALTTLYCGDNLLTSLDVNSNQNLTDFYCTNNQISDLNVANNTALTTLYCANNQLTSLNISNNTALTELGFNGNQLTNMDISNHNSLFVLEAHDNLLTNLNVANGNNTNFTYFFAQDNPNLNCIKVDDSAYSTANWTNVDATSSFSETCVFTSISDSQKESLSIYPNPTNGLVSFSTSENIKKIEIYNLAGQKVRAFNNVKTIDISNLPSGVYSAKIIVGDSNPVIERLIKN